MPLAQLRWPGWRIDSCSFWASYFSTEVNSLVEKCSKLIIHGLFVKFKVGEKMTENTNL